MPSDDKLIIETPEQTALEFPLAGIGSRSLALAIDTLLQIGALLGAAAVIGLLAYAGFVPNLGKQWLYAVLIFIGFLVEFGYFAFFEAVWNGQTPGKRWTHLRVMKDTGRPIGAPDAVLRNLLRIVDSLPSLYAAGIVTCLLSPQNKRIGDYLAGTVVVHEEPLQGGRSIWDAAATPLLATAPPRTFTAAELQLIETFLERRSSFPDDVRRAMARQIADRVTQGWPAPQEKIQDTEKFLQAVVEHYRNSTYFR
jgi:uncharacterized RDD family membrane protein YckC